MDLRTGHTYASVEEAQAAGVPMTDLVKVEGSPTRPRISFPVVSNPRYPVRHQGARERRRHREQQER